MDSTSPQSETDSGPMIEYPVVQMNGDDFTIELSESAKTRDANEVIAAKKGYAPASQQILVNGRERPLGMNEVMAQFEGQELFLLLSSESNGWHQCGQDCEIRAGGLEVVYTSFGSQWNLATSGDIVGGVDPSGKPRKTRAYWEVEISADSAFADTSFDIGAFSPGGLINHDKGHFWNRSGSANPNGDQSAM